MSNYSDSSFDESSANTSWYKIFHLVPQGSKVLDVGCSSGNFGVELINRKQCQVDGIELSAADAQLARQHYGVVHELNIESDSLAGLATDYDIIYFGDVIEHLVAPSAALARLKPYLKPTGLIMFSIPNMAHIAVRLGIMAGKFEYSETGLLDKTHLHYYDREEVERVFADAGYELQTLDYVRKDYPRELIADKLGQLGLTASETFYNHAAQVEASAVQWVGAAKPGKPAKPKPRLQFGPIDDFERYLTDIKFGYEQRITQLEAEVVATKQQLELLHHHPLLRLARKVQRIVKR